MFGEMGLNLFFFFLYYGECVVSFVNCVFDVFLISNATYCSSIFPSFFYFITWLLIMTGSVFFFFFFLLLLELL